MDYIKEKTIISKLLFMKNIFNILPLIFLSLIGCKDAQRPGTTSETPKALQDKNSSSELSYKNRSNDMVEDIYKELTDKTAELQDLENKISNVQESQADSTASFDKYNDRIQSYFGSANAHIENVQDSILKQKMKILISNSLADYNLKVLAHAKLLAEINAGMNTLDDLHTIVKIVVTLPLITKYETENKPSTSPLAGFKTAVDKTLKLADSIIKR